MRPKVKTLTVYQLDVENVFHEVEMTIQGIYAAVVLFCILDNYQVRSAYGI